MFVMDAIEVTSPRLPDCLPEAIRVIAGDFEPIRIVLFGSWARGTARPDSDLDLLVVLPTVDNKRQVTISILRALNTLPISKDIVVSSPEEIARRGNIVGDILRPALREGVVVYERD